MNANGFQTVMHICSISRVLRTCFTLLFVFTLLLCSEQFKCVTGKQCIDRKMVCDKTNDCQDMSDEGGFCGACDDHPCEHECLDGPFGLNILVISLFKQTLTGPTCTCPNGMVLAADGHHCEDVNECTTGLLFANVCRT
jgi:hypothetical protein